MVKVTTHALHSGSTATLTTRRHPYKSSSTVMVTMMQKKGINWEGELKTRVTVNEKWNFFEKGSKHQQKSTSPNAPRETIAY